MRTSEAQNLLFLTTGTDSIKQMDELLFMGSALSFKLRTCCFARFQLLQATLSGQHKPLKVALSIEHGCRTSFAPPSHLAPTAGPEGHLATGVLCQYVVFCRGEPEQTPPSCGHLLARPQLQGALAHHLLTH